MYLIFSMECLTNTLDLKKSFQLNKFFESLKIHFITILNETHKTNGQITLEV
jgi:hypothetical protein